jgi:hypothetical protein
MYDSSTRAVKGNQAGMTTHTYLNPAYVLDTNFNVSTAWIMAPDVAMVSGPDPYLPIIPRTVTAQNTVPKLQMVQFGNYPLLDYIGQGGPADLIGVQPLPLLYNITDRSGLTAPVSNQPLWFVFGNGDESFLVRSRETGIKTYSEILKLRKDMSRCPTPRPRRHGEASPGRSNGSAQRRHRACPRRCSPAASMDCCRSRPS